MTNHRDVSFHVSQLNLTCCKKISWFISPTLNSQLTFPRGSFLKFFFHKEGREKVQENFQYLYDICRIPNSKYIPANQFARKRPNLVQCVQGLGSRLKIYKKWLNESCKNVIGLSSSRHEISNILRLHI